MKKGFIVFSLFFVLLFATGAVSYAQTSDDVNYDIEKIHAITEIGTLSNAGKSTEALSKCNAALVKYPNEADLYYWSATIKSDLGNHKGAIKDFDKAIALNPKDNNVYVMRGIAKSELNDYQGAITDFNRAIVLNPKDSSAYSMRACVKLEMGDLDGAVSDLKYANKLFEEKGTK